VDRLNIGKIELVPGCPPKEAPDGPGVSLSRIRIADFGGEELDHALGGLLAGVLKNGRKSRSELGNQVGHKGRLIGGILGGGIGAGYRLRSTG